MTSTLELLKQDKCYCLKKQEVIDLMDCEMMTCHREKGCRKSANNKVEKELNNNGKEKHI